MNNDLKTIYGDMIGITGIIGSGKSTAAAMFAEYGFCVIDADALVKEIYHESYHRYSILLKQLQEQIEPLARRRLNQSIISEENTINRPVLAKLVFNDEEALKVLNQIVHPHVQEMLQVKKQICQAGDNKNMIYDVPLLFENELHLYLKKTIVVYCPEDVALLRAVQRSQLPVEEVKKRIDSQISIEKKRKLADYVLYNEGSLENLREQVEVLAPTLLKI